MKTEMNIGEMNGAVLAYLGDAVFELTVRRYLIEKGVDEIGRLNREADAMVRATAQSAAMDKLMPYLSEGELAAFKRGRNTHSHTVPKSASVSEYRKATGFEALFGYLYMEKRDSRISELFDIIVAQGKEEEK